MMQQEPSPGWAGLVATARRKQRHDQELSAEEEAAMREYRRDIHSRRVSLYLPTQDDASFLRDRMEAAGYKNLSRFLLDTIRTGLTSTPANQDELVHYQDKCTHLEQVQQQLAAERDYWRDRHQAVEQDRLRMGATLAEMQVFFERQGWTQNPSRG